MKRFSTLLAGLLLVGAVASAADYSATSEVTYKNEGGGDAHIIDVDVAKGFMALGEATTFTFEVSKEFEEKGDGETREDEFKLVRRLPSMDIAGKTFSNEVSLGLVLKEDNSGTASTEDKKLTYVTGTDIMGMSTDLELLGALDDDDNDTYEANLYLGNSFGENWSLSVELYNAYANDGEHTFSYENYLNYNMDLGAGFAFNTEFSLNGGEYKDATFYAAPKISYSYSVNDEVTFFSAVVYEAFKASTDDIFDEDFDQVDGNAEFSLGFSYSK